MEQQKNKKQNTRRKNSSKRNASVRWLRSLGLPCAICHEPIDYTLPARHPYSFECDEIIPVSKGGSPYDRNNLQPAHRICNERRGNRMDYNQKLELNPVRTTTKW